MKYYAIKVGKQTGIFNSWDECKQYVQGFPGAVYKSFNSYDEAENFLNTQEQQTLHAPLELNTLNVKEDLKCKIIHAFIDGSQISEKGKHTMLQPLYGVLILQNNPLYDGSSELVATMLSGSVKSMPGVTNIKMSNQIAGELYSAIRAVQYAIRLKMKKVVLYYDYAGIEQWAIGSWDTKNELSISYNNQMKTLMNHIEVNFVKVKGHSNLVYNEVVDLIAKSGKFFD